MDRRLRMGVVEGEKIVRLVNDAGGDFTVRDLFENGHASEKVTS